jgi:site-specific DNA-methyltransferase (adenine-specific)
MKHIDTNLIHGECLEEMAKLPDGCVDMVMTDPPYGTTACKWDSVIPLEPMWEQLKRLIKPNGAIVMTASQPFTTTLIASNMKMFKYCWVWEKEQGTNQFLAKIQPMKKHEDILVYGRGKVLYNPQFTTGKRIISVRDRQARIDPITGVSLKPTEYDNKGKRFPTTVIQVNRELVGRFHPTQKPVALMEYLIKTYTNEGETVLDFTMGSGTTGVACSNLNREFIGIERDDKYFEIAKNRIGKAQVDKPMDLFKAKK